MRTEERAMQFFGLMNRILNCKIRIYSVTPLAPHLGLVEWVSNAPTFASLIVPPGRSPDLHWGVLNASFTGWNGLKIATIPQKIEMYEASVPPPSQIGRLRDAIWIHARSSELWLKYQSSFTDSLAVMSIVGYVAGIGDRHLKNLLFEKKTGLVVHIDFGWAFDFARTRQSVPETVPFRATPVIGFTCGPQRFGGEFRRMCIRTMTSIAQNFESVAAVFNVFQEEPIREGGIIARPLVRTDSEKNEARAKWESILKLTRSKIPGVGMTNQHVTIEEKVDRLIEEATNPYNLARMYEGWAAWL
jgi:FKBP12-rapamycin complex-associated protein